MVVQIFRSCLRSLTAATRHRCLPLLSPFRADNGRIGSEGLYALRGTQIPYASRNNRCGAGAVSFRAALF